MPLCVIYIMFACVKWMESVDCYVSKRHETQPYNRILRQIPPAIPGTYGRMILSVV